VNMLQFLYYRINISFFECESYSFSSHLILLQQELSAGRVQQKRLWFYSAEFANEDKVEVIARLYLDVQEGRLKETKLQILGFEVFTKIRPIWVGDLGTIGLKLGLTIAIFVLFSAVADSALKNNI
jgi:hypothetical protein